MKIKDRIKSLRRVKASDLAPNPKNWRTHPKAQREAMQGLLAEIGFAGAALARETPEGLELIDGHLRSELAPDAKIPVLVLDVTAEEADKILATFDPIGKMAEASQERLAELLGQIETNSAPLQALLDTLAVDNGIEPAGGAADTPDPGPQLDRAAQLKKKWKTKLGQVWEIPGKAGVHRVMCGDSTKAEEVARLMVEEKAALCFTDPPYGCAYDGGNRPDKHSRQYVTILANDDSEPEKLGAFATAAVAAIDALLAPGGVVYLFGMMWNFTVWHPVFEAAFKIRAIPIWVKDNPAAGRSDFFHGYEIMLYGTKAGAKHKWNGGRGQTDVWTFPNVNSFGYVKDDGAKNAANDAQVHPTQKPTALVAHALDLSSDATDLVADPFLGSGTTLIAAEQLGRVCYGMEISPKYVAVILQRAKDAGLTPTLTTDH